MAYDDLKSRIREGWQDTLHGILAQARSLGAQAVLAFDLDSTLFDNRPRQSRIVREFGAARGLTQLGVCVASHWTSGWDMKAAMRNCGLSSEQVEAVYSDARAFWVERFFTSEYCLDDGAIEGAAAFTHAVAGTGAQLAYVTGRHEGMRAGTVEAMRPRRSQSAAKSARPLPCERDAPRALCAASGRWRRRERPPPDLRSPVARRARASDG
jgi:hypothetical protein